MAAQPPNSAQSVFRGMYRLILGAGAARMIGLLSMPVLTRIYGPESFGTLAVFTAFVTQIMPVLTLRYAVALPLPRREGAALNLFAVSLGLIVLLSVLCGCALALLAAPLLIWLQAEAILGYWWLIPIGAAAMAIFDLLSLWATRQRAYGRIAKAQVLQAAMGEGCKVGLGVAGFHPIGLLAGHVTSQTVGALALFGQIRTALAVHRRQIRLGRMRAQAKRYRGFPLFRLPSQVLLGFAAQAPLMFVAALYDTATAGQFALAMTAMALPMSLIGRTMSQAYYGEAAKLRHDPADLWRVSVAVQRRLFLFGIPFAVTLIFAAEPVFVFVFGSEWRQAGQFTALLAVFLVLQITSAPLMQVLNLLEKQWVFLFINLTRVAGLWGVYGLAMYGQWDVEQFVPVIAGVLAMFYGAQTLFILALLWLEKSNRG